MWERTQKKRKQKLHKSRLLSSTKGEENRIESLNRIKLKTADIKIAEIEEFLYNVCHVQGFCRKLRSINSVSYSILRRV